jgi:hypothetical protein
MARPIKLKDEMKQYSLLISVEQYNRLAAHAARLQKRSFEQVSAADLMRTAISIYIDVLDEDVDEEARKQA